jgi:hypothetical protein
MVSRSDFKNPDLWVNVPEVIQERDFIVDEAKDNVFTVLVDQNVADYDVAEAMYLVGGIWRIVANDTDDDEEVPSMLLEVTVDRRFKVEEVRTAVTKLLENLYRLESDNPIKRD